MPYGKLSRRPQVRYTDTHIWMADPDCLTYPHTQGHLARQINSRTDPPRRSQAVFHRAIQMTNTQSRQIILASASGIRAAMLENAGLVFAVQPGRIDEQAVKESLLAGGGKARDLADTLAEMKALKISDRNPDALVIGADQVLECDGRVFSKPETPADAMAQLQFLSGKTHSLHAAAVVCENGQPIWRHVGAVRLTMHDISDSYLTDYIARNWDSVRHAVGCYKIEAEGVRLFSRIDGDFFHILGLPLIELLTWLRIRGDIPA